jgi:hypothetical protein
MSSARVERALREGKRLPPENLLLVGCGFAMASLCTLQSRPEFIGFVLTALNGGQRWRNHHARSKLRGGPPYDIRFPPRKRAAWRDTGMSASHYACQSPSNKIGLFHVTC